MMKYNVNLKILNTVMLVSIATVIGCGAVNAVDESLTPTEERSFTRLNTADTVKADSESEQEFKSAMSVWLAHNYSHGEALLRDFSAKHPNSRWTAEADLHIGCNLTYQDDFDEAEAVFDKVIAAHPDHIVATKAKLRLGNVAERAGRFDEAIDHYCGVLKSNSTWDQFRYSNFAARKLMITRRGWQARQNCGPVALAVCLSAIGKPHAAEIIRKINAGPDGMTLARLEAESDKYGVQSHPVLMTVDKLKLTSMPILAHVQPNHYIAITAIIDDKAQVEDSIRGKYEISLDALNKIWSGIVLSFGPATDNQLVAEALAHETAGGCCGQADGQACLGDCTNTCNHIFISSFDDDNCPTCGEITSGPPSAGSPTWKINTANLNLVVKDTPIWYNPGNGPQIAFTLTYNNESSDSGIFGRGWRSPYDMKVFFLPPPVEGNPVSLQVHRENGRIETYDYDTTTNSYIPNAAQATYGYFDTVSKLSDGTVVISLREGGKYYFIPEGSVAEGRIHYIDDAMGNRVTCVYDGTTGVLKQVIDAAGGITEIQTQGTGLDERVLSVTIPEYDIQTHKWGDGNGRSATFSYTDGYLTSITDMLTCDPDNASKLTYGALAWPYPGATSTTQAITTLEPSNGQSLQVQSTAQFPPSGTITVYDFNGNSEQISYTSVSSNAFENITRGSSRISVNSGADVEQVFLTAQLAQNVSTTPISPDNNGTLLVNDTTGFPNSGTIAICGENGTEVMTYTSKTQTSFLGIKRGSPTYSAQTGDSVQISCSVPYLYTLETPSTKTKFGYFWYSMGNYALHFVVGLGAVYECAIGEDYPESPTMQLQWDPVLYSTYVTRYPGPNGLTRSYLITPYAPYDESMQVKDELGVAVKTNSFNSSRDIISTTDANGNVTHYSYTNPVTDQDDNQHDMYARTDALGNTWIYTYANHKVTTEKDPLGRVCKAYTYNATDQVTKIETELTANNRSTLVQNWYYTNNPNLQSQPYYTYSADANLNGKIEHSLDGQNNQTTYHYNENGETRGFLTSTEDAEHNKTSYHYDSKGRQDQVTYANGAATSYQYDNLDRLTKVTNPDGTTVETSYTCCHKEWSKDESGNMTRYEYDTKNRLWAVINTAVNSTIGSAIAPGDTQISLLSTAGFPISGTVLLRSSDGVGTEIVTYTGISGNTITGVTRGQFGTLASSFSSGNAVEGNFEVNVYDADVLDGSGHYIHRGVLNRKIGLFDPNGHLTQYSYYDNGSLMKTSYPDGTWEHYTYDPAGNMLVKEYGHANMITKTINYVYDANNRLAGFYGE